MPLMGERLPDLTFDISPFHLLLDQIQPFGKQDGKTFTSQGVMVKGASEGASGLETVMGRGAVKILDSFLA